MKWKKTALLQKLTNHSVDKQPNTSQAQQSESVYQS